MASTVGKTPPKPANDKKDNNPVKKEETERKSQEKDSASPKKDFKDDQRQNRESRFHHNRRGRPFQRRGGFQGRDDRDSGSGGGFNSGGMNQSSGDFTGEQNDGPKEQKKFTGRCRLFVGNITPDTTEEQFTSMFTPYGEVSEVFVNAARGFGFIRLVS